MKTFIKITTFLSVLLLLVMGISKIVTPKNNAKEFGMENVKASGILGERPESIEALVVGDSEAYCSISPLQVFQDSGIPIYVSASSAQFLYQSIDFVEMALKNQKLKYIFLETNNIFRGYESLDYIFNFIENKLPVFRYHNFWKSINLNNSGRKVEYTWTDDYKGFYIQKGRKASLKKNHMMNSVDKQKISELNQNHVAYINKLAKENGAKLVLISTPSTLNWNMKKHNAVVELAKENDVEYIDLNLMDIGINWETDTFDKGDHVNYLGAKKVTSFLTNYLKGTNQFTDQRNNPKYRDWKISLEKYLM
ncbi:MAG: hypothetical protein WBO70_04995, partial [Erysipelotrichaceae bacterium]